MKKIIVIAVMAVLFSSISVWAGDTYEPAVPQSTHKTSSDRLHMEHERKKMSGKMSGKERGPMLESTSKKSSNRLEGKREKMTHTMDNNRYGAMTNTTPHKHGHRLKEGMDGL